jgi:ERCC4-type nuclease
MLLGSCVPSEETEVIIVAPETGSKELLLPLRARLNCDVEIQPLKNADFCFSGNGPEGKVLVGIERKQIADFCGCMRTDHFTGKQMVEMMDVYDVCYLLIEGLYRPSAKGMLETYNYRSRKWELLNLANWKQRKRGAMRVFQYDEVDKHLCTVENKKGFILLRSGSETETVWQIVNRYQWWNKAWDSHTSADAIKFQAQISWSKLPLARDVASRLPGIGKERSKEVFQAFGTVEAMVEAFEEEWQELLGPKVGSRVYTALRSKG